MEVFAWTLRLLTWVNLGALPGTKLSLIDGDSASLRLYCDIQVHLQVGQASSTTLSESESGAPEK